MKRIQIMALALLLALLCTGCGFGKAWHEIRMEQAGEWMAAHEGYLLVDVRDEEEFNGGHLPGAILVPIDDIREGRLDALPDTEQTLLLYCRTGRRSEDAAEILTKLGYRNVYTIGGIFDWPGEIVTEEAQPDTEK